MKKLITLCLLLMVTSGVVFGGTSGKIVGTILDNNGAPLAGVNVYLEGSEIGASTNADGYYAILNIPPGLYTMKVTYIGFTTVTVENIFVSIDLTTYQDLILQPEVLSTGEDIVVVAERPLLNQDEFSSKHIVSSEEMEIQPIENVIGIAQNQAGVVGNNFRGGRSDEVLVVIDGIPVRDPSAAYVGDLGGFSLGVPKDAVKEMEVSLGGFSAEYGNVQSGVLNLAMKEGSQKFSGSLYATTTDFGPLTETLMPKNDWWLDAKYQQRLDNNYRFSLSGPILPSMTFAVSGDIFNRKQGNYLHQQEASQNYQGKVAWKISDKMKLAVGSNYSKRDWDNFYFPAAKFGPGPDFQTDLYEFVQDLSATNDTLTRYHYVDNPSDYLSGVIDSLAEPYTIGLNDSDTVAVNYHRDIYLDTPLNHLTTRTKESSTLYGILTYTFSARTFMELRTQFFKSSYKNGMKDYQDRDGDGNTDEYLQWDPSVPGPRPEKRVLENEDFWWLIGDDNSYTNQKVNTFLLKWDLTSQVSQNHMLKTGFQYNLNGTDVTDIYWSSVSDEAGFALNSLRKDIWNKNDDDFGAYVQDKMEFRDDFVALVGLRYDYFNPNGTGKPVLYPGNMDNPLAGHDANDFALFNDAKEAKPSWQFSPRIGISHPISDRDILFFSYGHYFQRPDGMYLFANYQYQSLTKTGNWVGNPALQPEKTVAYDISFEHLFTKNLKMSVTGYFKDVTNLVNNELFVFPDGTEVHKYVNGDYANIKGAELAVKRLRSGFWSLQGNVSYSIAKGRSSSAGSHQLFPYDKKMYYLSFDRRISANVNFGLYSNKGIPGFEALTRDWIANFQCEYGTGKPYTSFGIQGAYNDQRLPDYNNIDMRISRRFNLKSVSLTLNLDVFNLGGNGKFSYIQNVEQYGLTGFPDVIYKVEETNELIRTPQVYPSKRQFKLGLSINF